MRQFNAWLDRLPVPAYVMVMGTGGFLGLLVGAVAARGGLPVGVGTLVISGLIGGVVIALGREVRRRRDLERQARRQLR